MRLPVPHLTAAAIISTAFALVTSITPVAAAPAAAQPASATGGANASPYDIVVTDQASDRIIVLDANDVDWTSGAERWAWKPTAAEGFGDLTDNWGLPDEAKLRHRDGRRYLLTTDSYGLAAVVPYPTGRGSYWAADVGRADNAHSIELLPSGNVAVTASTGGWVRIYTASQGRRSAAYTQLPLAGAHGAVWDPTTRLLWTLGDHELVGLSIGGTRAEPTITRAVTHPLPTAWGHDLQLVPHRPDRLWVTTGSRVYQVDKATGTFHDDYPGAETIDVAGVKSVTTNPATGQVITTKTEPGNPCTWCTSTVRMHRPTDSRTLPGGQIYKARWWVDYARGAQRATQ
ncbi:DUF6528 family protein [Nocardioides albus]|uniref:WD40 repeat domain-containing protein n=1 Tax=Nocardioides albus TaxID=1841 RepID=A0A7W5A451_9ACTN|nr:DUF6528 family protein [Nocardioides albus]MBB3089130.1 hypothetical protein [Nocardioides albus]GGU14050.1 hypothetical protein GCM10007979_10570 [Nocardioides albus]